MLYAVSDALVNPSSGSSTQTARKANVLAKKDVTLISSRGAVGTYADQATTITVEDLTGSRQIENMKKLMNVGASDITANRQNGKLVSFTIKPNMPLGVKADGMLNVQAGGHVFVAGRTDAAGNSAINVGNIYAAGAGDVRLYSALGVYNALDASQTNITGHDLIVTGGTESIGKSDKPLTVSLSGDLKEARADKDVFIKNMNNSDYLRLGAMFAGNTISVDSEKGFRMSSANSAIAESYINAGKTLELKTNANTGIVGEANNPIRILNDRAAVNIAAQSAYIRGMGSLALGIQNGTLVLGTITTKGEFVAESDGSIAVGRDEETSAGKVVKEEVTGKITTGGNATLSATDDLTLNGTVTVGNPESNQWGNHPDGQRHHHRRCG